MRLIPTVKEVGSICFVSDCPIRAFSSGESPRVLVLSAGFAGVWHLIVLYMSYQVPHSDIGCEFRYRTHMYSPNPRLALLRRRWWARRALAPLPLGMGHRTEPGGDERLEPHRLSKVGPKKLRSLPFWRLRPPDLGPWPRSFLTSLVLRLAPRAGRALGPEGGATRPRVLYRISRRV